MALDCLAGALLKPQEEVEANQRWWITLSREVGVGIEDSGTTIESGHAGVADSALENQLSAVRGHGTH